MDLFLFLLRPTPTLWTLALPHRTQILYNVDIGFIATMLRLKPGCRVVEAGTGSASLSHTMARIIYNSDSTNARRRGHLFTFEYHEQRFKDAREEFRRNGFDEQMITITHQDVCANGFENKVETQEQMKGSIDAIFLDLPKPHECIQNVDRLLRKGGRFCGFSPCIEQIQKTADALRKNDFIEIRTFEVLNKVYREEKVNFQVPDFTFIKEAPQPEPEDINMSETSQAKPSKKKDKNSGESVFGPVREMR
ncbi:hypothetical protein AKO1_000764, partial [Acrasis kona]